MPKFPTEVERSVTAKVPLARAYEYFWNVVGSAACVPGIDRCERVGDDTYRFVYQERSAGPVSMIVQYTARYEGNGTDKITFAGIDAAGDNTDVKGSIRLRASGAKGTKITLRQMLAPEAPVPRLMQGLLKSYMETEAGGAVEQFLAAVKQQLEASA